MKLNLGCGTYYAPGWTNIDVNREGDVCPDIVADITESLPAPRGKVMKFYAGHILEHLPIEKVVDVLNMWHSYAVPGARLLTVGPDCDRGRQWVRDGKMKQEELDGMGVNGTPGNGYAHLWEATEANTLELLEASKWCGHKALPVTSVPSTWPLTSRIGWQFAILSTA